MNTLPVIQHLYTTCRNAGVWARFVLETENRKETITFSSTVSRPSNLPEETCWKDRGRRKKPSKIKKDQLRREAWLERRRTVQERVVAENPAAAPETDPAPGYAGDVNPAPGAPGDGPDRPIDTLESLTPFLDTLETATLFPDPWKRRYCSWTHRMRNPGFLSPWYIWSWSPCFHGN